MAAKDAAVRAEWNMLQVGVVAVFLAAAAIYAVPSLIAALKGHRRWPRVVALNILLGWTIVGWLLALAIALRISPRLPAWMRRSRKPRPKSAPQAPQSEVATRGDVNDPPEIREDVYAAWLDQGAGLEAGGQG